MPNLLKKIQQKHWKCTLVLGLSEGGPVLKEADQNFLLLVTRSICRKFD